MSDRPERLEQARVAADCSGSGSTGADGAPPFVRTGAELAACTTWSTVTIPADRSWSTMPTPIGVRRLPSRQRLTLRSPTPNSRAAFAAGKLFTIFRSCGSGRENHRKIIHSPASQSIAVSFQHSRKLLSSSLIPLASRSQLGLRLAHVPPLPFRCSDEACRAHQSRLQHSRVLRHRRS
jgi:hypothetical protein